MKHTSIITGKKSQNTNKKLKSLYITKFQFCFKKLFLHTFYNLIYNFYFQKMVKLSCFGTKIFELSVPLGDD